MKTYKSFVKHSFMDKVKIPVSMVILLFFTSFDTYPQSPTKVTLGPGYGAYFHYNLNSHVADFQKLPDVPNCCPQFKSGSGSGFSFGLLFDHPFMESLSGQLRAGYSILDGNLTSYEPINVAVGDTSVLGEFEHSLETKISEISLQPMIAYKLFDRIKLNFGLNIAYLAGKTYSQYEKISKPLDQGTFLDDKGQDSKTRIRHQYSGDIPQASAFQMALIGGVGIELPLNKQKSLLLHPEVFYRYSLTPVISNYKWNVNAIHAGLSLIYSTTKRETIEFKRDDEQRDRKIIAMAQEYELVGNPNSIIYGSYNRKDDEYISKNIESGAFLSIRAVGVNEGIEEEKVVLRIEEFLSNNMRPLLNYIFFDKNESSLAQRFIKIDKSATNDFETEKLNKSGTLETYYHILNIIGKRMQKHPQATISLVGCNADAEKEKGNRELSKNRAETISNYLIDVWNIDKNRIKLDYRNLPEKFSNPKNPDGVEENRRVEIYSDTWEVIEPVLTSDTLVKVNPPMIKFYLDAKTSSSIAKWKVTASQSGKILKVFDGEGDVPQSIDWRIDKEKGSIPRFTENVDYIIEVSDKDGNTYSSGTKSIVLEQITLKKKKESKIGDKRIDNYSLILFQFNSAELSEANNKITSFIKSRVEVNSKLLISGYTDRVGDPARNLELSEDRAKAVGKIMDNTNVYTRPMGNRELLYENDLPEGRYYCRTVIVEVETPIKW